MNPTRLDHTPHDKPDTIAVGNIVLYTPSDGRRPQVGYVTGFHVVAGKTQVSINSLHKRGTYAYYDGGAGGIGASLHLVRRVTIDVPVDPYIVGRMAPRKVA